VCIDSDGKFTKSGGNDCTVSSARFKDNITSLKLDSDLIAKLSPRSFTWKTDGTSSFGLIAEEVEDVYPELVTYDADGKPASVKYDLLSVLLLDYLQTHELGPQKTQQTVPWWYLVIGAGAVIAYVEVRRKR
jgi:hypothetical protein